MAIIKENRQIFFEGTEVRGYGGTRNDCRRVISHPRTTAPPRHRLFLRNILERFLQQLPERSDRLDEGTLGGGVRRLHRGAEAHHVEVWILTEDDRALQSGVVYLDDTVLAKQILILLQQQMQNL